MRFDQTLCLIFYRYDIIIKIELVVILLPVFAHERTYRFPFHLFLPRRPRRGYRLRALRHSLRHYPVSADPGPGLWRHLVASALPLGRGGLCGAAGGLDGDAEIPYPSQALE